MMAITEYLSRKIGIEHPHGRQTHSKWYPSDLESATCCSKIRDPSHSYPWSLFKHCLSLNHIATKYDLPPENLKDLLKKKNLPLLLSIPNDHIRAWIEKKLKPKTQTELTESIAA